MVPCWFECLTQNVYFQGYESVHDHNAARIQEKPCSGGQCAVSIGVGQSWSHHLYIDQPYPTSRVKTKATQKEAETTLFPANMTSWAGA